MKRNRIFTVIMTICVTLVTALLFASCDTPQGSATEDSNEPEFIRIASDAPANRTIYCVIPTYTVCCDYTGTHSATSSNLYYHDHVLHYNPYSKEFFIYVTVDGDETVQIVSEEEIYAQPY